MRTVSLITVTTAALALAGCMAQAQDKREARDQAAVDKALAGLVPGKQTSCIATRLASNANTEVYGKVLLYRFSNGDVYRNDTTGGCEGNGDDLLVQIEQEGRPCSGDIIRTVDRYSRIPTGSCALGQFTPYLKPRK